VAELTTAEGTSLLDNKMPFKYFKLSNSQNIKIVKRRKSKYIRLRINHNGQPELSIPYWTPYIVGLQYANSKLPWIQQNTKTDNSIIDGQPIGKDHMVRVIDGHSNFHCKIKNNIIEIKVEKYSDINDFEKQELIKNKCVLALRHQAENHLPSRLRSIAEMHGLNFLTVSIKNLKSRWGSCDQNKNIVLNLHSMHLPWDLIDYVLLHELTHTEIMRHGNDYWEMMERLMPDVKLRRKAIKNFSLISITVMLYNYAYA
jgi:predicted metal-dependent hydrolase